MSAGRIWATVCIEPTSLATASWNSLPPDVRAARAAVGAWWEGFRDPTLDSLIRRAVEGNLDLRQAVGRVAEARALYRADASARFPTVDADGQVSYLRASENGFLPGGEAETLHSVGLSASWEVDLFGRVRRLVEAAEARTEAAEEDRRAVLVAITADLATRRASLMGGAASGVVAGAAATTILAVLGVMTVVAVAPVAVVAPLSVVGAQRAMAATLERTHVAIEQVLDRLERRQPDVRPPSLLQMIDSALPRLR